MNTQQMSATEYAAYMGFEQAVIRMLAELHQAAWADQGIAHKDGIMSPNGQLVIVECRAQRDLGTSFRIGQQGPWLNARSSDPKPAVMAAGGYA
jgi:hypothetical protein